MIEIKDIEKLAELARIDMPQEEKEAVAHDLDAILAYVGQIKEAHAAAETLGAISRDGALVSNVLRDDAVVHESGIYTEALLAEVPRREGNYVQVKKIL